MSRDAESALEFDPDLVHGAWVQIASNLMRCPKLSANAKVLYGVLLSYAAERSVAWPGQKTLAEHLGIGERTLRNVVGELEAFGLVEVRRGGDGKTSRYHVRKYHNAPESEGVTATPETESRPVDSAGQKSRPANFASRPANSAAKLNTVEIQREAAAPRARVRETQASPTREDAAAAVLPRDTVPKPTPPSLPEGVSLLDVSDDVLAAVTPEVGLRRFRREVPAERWRDKFAEIGRRPGVKSTRVIQWLEARAILDELRDERERKRAAAERPTVPRRGPSPEWLARNRQRYSDMVANAAAAGVTA